MAVLPVRLRWIVGLISILMIGYLMLEEVIQPMVGLTVIIGILSALGLYHRWR